MIHQKSNAFSPPNPENPQQKESKWYLAPFPLPRANFEKGMPQKPSQNPPGKRRAGRKMGACSGADSDTAAEEEAAKLVGGTAGSCFLDYCNCEPEMALF